VLVVCCDGLSGFGDAIEEVWPQATVQTCVVCLIRNSIRYASWKHRTVRVRELRPVYQAAIVDAAAAALNQFEADCRDQYPSVVKLWRANWERFSPFLAFDPAIRKII
jgi:putative transposase